MEVKPGYKQTEVGVIPEEWDAIPLKGKVGIAHGFAFASEHFASHGPYRLATPGHFYEAGGFRDIGEKQKYYVGPVPSDYVLQPGDVIVAMTEQADGLLGSAALIPEENGYLHNQRLGRVTVLSSEIQLDYLVYVFNSPSYRTKVRETAAGTKVKHTSPEKLLEISVRLPPLPEQRAIATALSDVDGLLGGLDRLIAKQRDLKQAAMQQLLTGQTRLPGFHGEWEVKTIFDLAERKKERFDDGDWIESEHITTEGIRLIQTGNIGVGRYVEKEEKKYIYEASFTSLRCKQLRQGDLLICRLADPAGRACVLTDIGEERIVTSVDVTIFRPPPEMTNRLFLSNVFSTPEWFRAVSDRSGGTTHKRISRGALGRLAIKLPPVPEQTAIAEVLTEMDAELAGLEQRREKTRALKQAMMQELLTGRTRLI